jgi:Flp pilus assembly protein TadD
LRALLLISTCLFAHAVSYTDASAFGFGKSNQSEKNKPLRANNTPKILAPGEDVASDTQTQNELIKPVQKAGKQARLEARSLETITQTHFWTEEFAKDNKDEEAGFEAASGLLKIGSYDKALSTAANALQYNDKSARLWKIMGLALLNNQKPQEAAMALNKAKDLIPNDAGLMNSLGIAYDNLGQFDAAAKSYEAAYQMAPTEAKYLSNYGFSRLMAGDFKNAEAILRKATSYSDAPIQARQNLALVVGMQGRLAESEKIAIQDLPADMAQQNVQYLREMLNGNDRWKPEKL